jgi:putative restriction endonuclease
VARLKEVVEDKETDGHYYAVVEHYLDFDRPVPFFEGNSYYESALRKPDGRTSRGAFGRSVRLVPDGEFDNILRAGFAPVLQAQQAVEGNAPSEISEEAAEYRRPIVELTVLKPFRERSFMYNVRGAYSNRCAMTGLRLINGGGRPEVQAAHIQPVALNGPDSVRNGLALSGTVHWMFDRGLISVGDDYKILIAKDHVPEDAARLLNRTGSINLPADQAAHPNQFFLRFHRDNVFKG